MVINCIIITLSFLAILGPASIIQTNAHLDGLAWLIYTYQDVVQRKAPCTQCKWPLLKDRLGHNPPHFNVPINRNQTVPPQNVAASQGSRTVVGSCLAATSCSSQPSTSERLVRPDLTKFRPASKATKRPLSPSAVHCFPLLPAAFA